MRNSTRLLAAGTALALSFSATGLQAAGGGGGGSSSPTTSAPRYDATAEYQKGIAELRAENYKAAAKAFKRSLSVAPRNANGQYLLGLSYMRMDNYKKARKPLEKALKYDKNLLEAQRDLAITYHMLGQAEKAAGTLNALEQRQTACAGTCAQKAELNAAVSAVKKAMNDQDLAFLAPLTGFGLAAGTTDDAVYLSAVAQINAGQYEVALAELHEAGKNFGPHPDILTYLGFANRKLKRFETAEYYYKQALAVAPDHLGAIEYYGELKIERGDISGAKQHLARLESLCTFGCYEAEELRRWIVEAQSS